MTKHSALASSVSPNSRKDVGVLSHYPIPYPRIKNPFPKQKMSEKMCLPDSPKTIHDGIISVAVITDMVIDVCRIHFEKWLEKNQKQYEMRQRANPSSKS